MRVLVTGGNGFIGRRVIGKLLDRGKEVIVGDTQPAPQKDPGLWQLWIYEGTSEVQRMVISGILFR